MYNRALTDLPSCVNLIGVIAVAFVVCMIKWILTKENNYFGGLGGKGGLGVLVGQGGHDSRGGKGGS